MTQTKSRDKDKPLGRYLSSRSIHPSVHIHPSILLIQCGMTQVGAPCSVVNPCPTKPSRNRRLGKFKFLKKGEKKNKKTRLSFSNDEGYGRTYLSCTYKGALILVYVLLIYFISQKHQVLLDTEIHYFFQVGYTKALSCRISRVYNDHSTYLIEQQKGLKQAALPC